MASIKLKCNDKYIENITPGTTLYEVSKLVSKDYKYPIIGAKFNNIVMNLNEEVHKNGKVEFLDLSTSDGNDIYEKSLEFMIIAAAKEIYNDSDILINYSLDNGIYCELTGHRVTPKFVEKLDDKLKEFIKEGYEFIPNKVMRTDAIKYFKAKGELDKVNNLQYTTNEVIKLYKLKDEYDYFFGELAYNTKQINKYKVSYINSDTFVVSYPSEINPSKVLKPKKHEKILKEYGDHKKWTETIKINMASDLNILATKGAYSDAIRLFETHYESKLSSIAEDIFNHRNKVKVVLISGPSSSGKTTTSKKLGLYLKARGLTPHQVSLDDYLVNIEKTPRDENGDYDFDNIKATDIALFNKHLTRLLKGEKVNIPRHDFIKGRKVYEKNYLKLEENDILLVEGTNALNDILTSNIKRENKYKIFMSPILSLKLDNHNRIRTTDLRKIRRIVRDSRTRNTTAEETLKMWHNVDKGTFQNIYPYEDEVDNVINSSLSYEIGVLRIYAEALLYGIDMNSPVYSEAQRLINLLRQFMPMATEEIPRDSMLREFIGGGIYSD